VGSRNCHCVEAYPPGALFRIQNRGPALTFGSFRRTRAMRHASDEANDYAENRRNSRPNFGERRSVPEADLWTGITSEWRLTRSVSQCGTTSVGKRRGIS